MSNPDIALTETPSLDGAFAQLRAAASERPRSGALADLVDRRIGIASDDPALLDTFIGILGGAPVAAALALAGADLSADAYSPAGQAFGWFRLADRSALPVDGLEFSFALQQQTGFFEPHPVANPGWTGYAFRSQATLAFAFRGHDCLFAQSVDWRLGIVAYLFWRLLRLRPDALFFHAAAVGIGGTGTIFVGPGGAGKSTTALALAARGHDFLSDEVAGWLPATGELMPFRRPVSIKPGPRATAVERRLGADELARMRAAGEVRLDIGRLFPVATPRALPLRRIVFLRGFAVRPVLRPIAAGRAEVAALQPLLSSFLNEAHGRRMLQIGRMLSSADVFELCPGRPDETADCLEDAFRCP